jgi:hypothetical protein
MSALICPCCQRRLHAPEGCAGLLVQCAECRQTFTAPPGADTETKSLAEEADDATAAPERFERPVRGRRDLKQLGCLLGMAGAGLALVWAWLRWG